MVNLPTTTPLTANEVTQIAKCFDSLATQYQTLSLLFRGALERPIQKNVTTNSGQNIESPRTAKRKRKERDPNAPPRPMSAYLLFCQEVRENMPPDELAANKGTNMMTISGARWRALSESDKHKYNELAELETKKYKEDMARYRAQADHPVDPETPSNDEPEPAPLFPSEFVADATPALKKKKGAAPNNSNVIKPDVITPPAEPVVPESNPEVIEATEPVDVKPEAPKVKSGKKSETPKVKTGKKKKASKVPVVSEHVIEPAVPEPFIEPVVPEPLIEPVVPEPLIEPVVPESVISEPAVELKSVSVTPPEEPSGKKKTRKIKKKSKANGVATV